MAAGRAGGGPRDCIAPNGKSPGLPGPREADARAVPSLCFVVPAVRAPAEPEEPARRLAERTPRPGADGATRRPPTAWAHARAGSRAFWRVASAGVRAAQARGAGGEAAAAMGDSGGAAEARGPAGAAEEEEAEYVKVRRQDLERLTTEVMQVRDFLPRVLRGEVLGSFRKLRLIEQNLERKDQELEQLRMDCEHFRARLETVQTDSVREKKEKLALRQQLSEVKRQLLQQAEYCTEMGAAACTLLWGVSSSEEAVRAILGGDKALKFFSITGQTMESFVKSLDGDTKELDSDENQFVFALAGIVTNVAAVACGREFLVNSGQVLLDTMLQLLGDLKPGQCTRLKVLMLMALFNVSINVKGLEYISENPSFLPLLWWLLSDPDAEVCFHVLRLVQSVVLEPEVFSRSSSEFRSSLPLQRIQAMAQSRNPRLQAVARELLEDLHALERPE